MRPGSPHGSAPSNQTVSWVALASAGALGLAILALLAHRRPPDPIPQEFEVTWKAGPVWPASPASPGWPALSPSRRGERPEPLDLAIYVDISEPLGGFVAPAAARETSDYEFVVDQLPDSLVAKAGSSGSRLLWSAVATEVSNIPKPLPLRRSLFIGTDSRLDLAVGALTRDLAAGRLRAGVLVTDLISTGDLTGAMGVAHSLSGWMSSTAVQSGSLHAGLLGVRAHYWGVRTPRCRTAAGSSCWFSEQRQKWQPLQGVARVPFYVLVLGRRREEVEKIGEGLLASAMGRKIEARWELLSAIAGEREAGGRCRLTRPGEPGEQFILVREKSGLFTCQRGEEVEIACSLPAGVSLLSPRLSASWPGAHAEPRAGQAVVTLDCGALRQELPRGDLRLRLEGAPEMASESVWDGWSTASDLTAADLGKTLQLESFLSTVRPRTVGLDVVSSALLRGRQSGP